MVVLMLSVLLGVLVLGTGTLSGHPVLSLAGAVLAGLVALAARRALNARRTIESRR
jgi:hypothetical protein